MGLAFKENIRDIRNSKAFDLIRELENYFIHVEAYDPEVDEEKVIKTQRIKMKKILADDYDAIIVAVSHDRFLKIEENEFLGMMDDENPILFDLKGIYKEFKNLIYWSL
jgi:UDP-N-acetyl-D-galactosamine dehydrogenase